MFFNEVRIDGGAKQVKRKLAERAPPGTELQKHPRSLPMRPGGVRPGGVQAATTRWSSSGHSTRWSSSGHDKSIYGSELAGRLDFNQHTEGGPPAHRRGNRSSVSCKYDCSSLSCEYDRSDILLEVQSPLKQRDKRLLCPGALNSKIAPVGVQAASIRAYMAASWRAAWTSTSTPKGDGRLDFQPARSPIQQIGLQLSLGNNAFQGFRVLINIVVGVLQQGLIKWRAISGPGPFAEV